MDRRAAEHWRRGRQAWLACLLAVTAVATPALATVRAQAICADLEPIGGLVARGACYTGAACHVGLRGEMLDETSGAIAVSASGVAQPLVVVARGAGSVLSTSGGALCVPPAIRADETYALLRVPALEMAGRHRIELRLPSRLGFARPPIVASLDVVESHGFLAPRQPAASEIARAGETRVITLVGRRLAALRVRADAPILRSASAPAEVLWVAPDQSQVRVRLTLEQSGTVSTRDVFEFVGSGESVVNRTLGWPLIRVSPMP